MLTILVAMYYNIVLEYYDLEENCFSKILILTKFEITYDSSSV